MRHLKKEGQPSLQGGNFPTKGGLKSPVLEKRHPLFPTRRGKRIEVDAGVDSEKSQETKLRLANEKR